MTNQQQPLPEVPRCQWCSKSVDGDPAADRGPGTTVLCFACRTLPWDDVEEVQA